MFNASARDEAIRELEREIEQHKRVLDDVAQASKRLFGQRKRAVDIIKSVEEYVNLLANSPKEFDKAIDECRDEVNRFNGAVERFQADAARVGTIGWTTGTAGAVAGAGVAAFAPSAALAIATTFGTASTGTAISALSGAAATNAALAWLGGGALAAGGGGMAGGSAFLALAGPVGWTIGGAALLGSGIYCYSQNRRLAEEAAEKHMEVERHIRSLEAANRKIAKIQRNTAKVVEGCEGDLRWLKTAPNDYRRFSKEQKQRLGVLINLVRALGALLNKEVMSRTIANRAADVGPPHVAAQAAAAWAAMDAAGRSDALADALREMQAVRDSVGSPSRILGSDAAKHGEIAEQVNVGIRRATDVLFERAPSATFEATGRFTPADYRVNGSDIQSRYYNGLRNTLNGVLGPIRDRENSLRQAAGPSWAGFGKATGLGAVVGGGVALTQMLWFKHREGRSPFGGQFSARDWSDVGVASAHGAGRGAVAGGALYCITNSTTLSAPAAGAVVSGLIGIGSLLGQYGAGRMDGDEFVEMSRIVAADAAIVGLATCAGQAVIPVPVLGVVLGSICGNFVASAIRNGLGDDEKALTARLDACEQRARAQLDAEFGAVVQNLEARFGHLERLAQTAFDETVNADLRLAASGEFAELVGVRNDWIVRGADDTDSFIRSER